MTFKEFVESQKEKIFKIFSDVVCTEGDSVSELWVRYDSERNGRPEVPKGRCLLIATSKEKEEDAPYVHLLLFTEPSEGISDLKTSEPIHILR